MFALVTTVTRSLPVRRAWSKGGADYSFGPGRRDDSKVDGYVVRYVDALASKRIQVFSVFTKECPVDALRRHSHRPHVGEQIESLSHTHVCRFEIRPLVAFFRGGRRSLERDVAGLDLRQNVVGDRLHMGRAVLDRQPFDVSEFDFVCGHFVGQQFFENLAANLSDRRSDAVTTDDADHHGTNRSVVHGCALVLYRVDPGDLLVDDCCKVVFGVVNCRLAYHSGSSMKSRFADCFEFARQRRIRLIALIATYVACRG